MTDTAVVEHVELQDVGRDLARELALARAHRGELAADAAAGDIEAAGQLEAVEARIIELERAAERAELAAGVIERRQRESALAASEAERSRLLAEAETLEAERDEVVGRAVLSAQTTAALALEAVELDRRVEANRRLLGMSHRAIESGVIVDRITIAMRDAGLDAGLEPMRAAWRASLLERWPTPAEPKASVALCTICAHPQRAEVDAALEAGTDTLRVLEERFGVSRSSLSRHRAHAAAASEP